MHPTTNFLKFFSPTFHKYYKNVYGVVTAVHIGPLGTITPLLLAGCKPKLGVGVFGMEDGLFWNGSNCVDTRRCQMNARKPFVYGLRNN